MERWGWDILLPISRGKIKNQGPMCWGLRDSRSMCRWGSGCDGVILGLIFKGDGDSRTQV